MNQINKILAIVLVPVLLTAGCKSRSSKCPLPTTNFYSNPDKPLTLIGRVILVELDNQSSQPEVSLDMTDALFQAIQKKNLFGLSLLRRQDPAYNGLLLQANNNFTLEQIALLRNTLKCDAVIIGSVTQNTPYPRLSIGVRLRMIDLRDGELVWAIEHLWDTTDKEVESRIDEYFKTQIRTGYDPIQYRMAIMSPRLFFKFVAFETAQTLTATSGSKILFVQ